MSGWLDGLTLFTVLVGIAIIGFFLLKLLFVPLALAFEARAGRKRRRRDLAAAAAGPEPLVSVVVPAYNEEKVIEHCLRSVLASDWKNLEVVVVDDGSLDQTVASARRVAAEDARLRVIAKLNGGKGSALNRGIAETSGEYVLLVDSDGVFAPTTIHTMIAAFDAPEVGAVCGDDRPVNLDRIQTKLLSVLSHVGTGLVRRALSLAGCLIIVSGNAGAFRREALVEVGGLDESTLGEDLELTWRLLRAGWQIRFEPRALVYAESPSTVKGLWKQRVRWARGLLQTTHRHRGMIGNPRYGVVGGYLLLNLVSMVIMPIFQLLVLCCLPVLMLNGRDPVGHSWWQVLLWTGVLSSLILAVLAIALNGEWHDLVYLWTLPLWPLYATLMTFTMMRAMWAELRGQEMRWNKLERTGVLSRQVEA